MKTRQKAKPRIKHSHTNNLLQPRCSLLQVKHKHHSVSLFGATWTLNIEHGMMQVWDLDWSLTTIQKHQMGVPLSPQYESFQPWLWRKKYLPNTNTIKQKLCIENRTADCAKFKNILHLACLFFLPFLYNTKPSINLVVLAFFYYFFPNHRLEMASRLSSWNSLAYSYFFPSRIYFVYFYEYNCSSNFEIQFT